MRFKSYLSYSRFLFSVKTKRRYIFDEDENNFIKAVIETSKNRIKQIMENSLLFRAQRGCDFRPVYQEDDHVADEEVPYRPERMVPLQEKSREGRANPRGIAYLYLASDENTACSEVRPWLNLPISLGSFRITRKLSVVDCRSDGPKLHIYFKEPNAKTREKCVWNDINEAFSKPVSPEDPETEYVPTQIIAEALCKAGHDGIIYKSSYDEGFNIVLFDFNSVEMVKCQISWVKNMKFNFDHEGPWRIVKPKKELIKSKN